jgi:hypothetical protein
VFLQTNNRYAPSLLSVKFSAWQPVENGLYQRLSTRLRNNGYQQYRAFPDGIQQFRKSTSVTGNHKTVKLPYRDDKITPGTIVYIERGTGLVLSEGPTSLPTTHVHKTLLTAGYQETDRSDDKIKYKLPNGKRIVSIPNPDANPTLGLVQLQNLQKTLGIFLRKF